MPRVRRRLLLASAVAVGLAASSIAWTSATAAAGTTSASQPQHNFIVVLRDQHTNLAIGKGMRSARVQATQRDQAPLLANASKMGARNVRGFSLVNGFAASMTAAQVNSIAANPQVAAVLPDLPISRPSVDTPSAAPGPATAATDTSTIWITASAASPRTSRATSSPR